MPLLVYRICLTRFADQLIASGKAGRWNAEGAHMIYSAGSLALACLENLVHRSGASISGDFSALTIFIPPEVKISTIKEDKIPVNGWERKEGITRHLGGIWVRKNETAVCKVPSAIIQSEYNYLINPNHHMFHLIKIVHVQPFSFDARLKQ
jgi:RES domain-containing protein